MKYETVKSFILFVLVGISFLLSFILWSYQPNYESFRDTSYVNEVDIGGNEKTKNELIEPSEIIFRNDEKTTGFMNPIDRQSLYDDIASWELYDYKLMEANGRPDMETFVELIFPTNVPVSLATNAFTFNDDFEPPDWSFERVFITFNDESQSLKFTILSVDGRNQIVATIEKSDTYKLLLSYMENDKLLDEHISFGTPDNPIYLPKEQMSLESKTLVATSIKPESFIDALFSDPSYVTPNLQEAYFTDGQRGMRIVHDGRILEYINPIQSNYERLTPAELIDKSINNINEHKGWTNNYYFENIDNTLNRISYRLYYEGYPVFDRFNLSVIKQEWREQELYQYNRPLVSIGNTLSSKEVELPAGEHVIQLLTYDKNINLENIKDIQIGYSLNYLDDAHSLTLKPSWYLLYNGEWTIFNEADYEHELHVKGGD